MTPGQKAKITELVESAYDARQAWESLKAGETSGLMPDALRAQTVQAELLYTEMMAADSKLRKAQKEVAEAVQPLGISSPVTQQAMSDDEARALVGSVGWYHSFELREGLTTPGVSEFHPAPSADALKIPKDLTGKRALDIGAWDGPLTFELERRGAQAFALDIQDPTQVGFDVARRVLGSNATHYQGSVYQLPHHELRDLDVVAFRGVFYHLKHPILAFERISAAMKVGGTLHFEGEALLRYAESLDQKKVKLDFASILTSGAPVCLIYPNQFKSGNNWFIPTPACLEACMIAAGFEVKEMNLYQPEEDPDAQRVYGYAVKVRNDAELREHPLYRNSR